MREAGGYARGAQVASHELQHVDCSVRANEPMIQDRVRRRTLCLWERRHGAADSEAEQGERTERALAPGSGHPLLSSPELRAGGGRPTRAERVIATGTTRPSGGNVERRQNPTAWAPERECMTHVPPPAETDYLAELRSGRQESLDRLVPLLYEELRVLARRQLAARGRGGTLETTGLIHETYLKLVDQSRAGWQDRVHFLALASLAMRHVLVDRAKARRALKRGGEQRRITLDESRIAVEDQAEALLQLDDALHRLAEAAPRLARVVEYRFFGGLTEEEVATALDITVRTVQRDWAKARLFLRRALEE